MNKKMADVDIDPFGEHESRPEEPTDEHIPLDPCSGASGPPVTPGRSSTWEPTREQETSFGGHLTPLHGARQSQRNRLLINQVEGLYERLSQKLPKPQKYFTTTCLNSEMGNCTLETKASP